MRPLVRANVLLFVLLLLHVADHVRQDRGIPAELTLVGFVGQAMVLVALVLALRDHPLAPEAAIAVGFGTAMGIVLVHGIPDWFALSDSYEAAHVDALSWAQAGLCVASAVWLGVVGTRARSIPSRAAAS